MQKGVTEASTSSARPAESVQTLLLLLIGVLSRQAASATLLAVCRDGLSAVREPLPPADVEAWVMRIRRAALASGIAEESFNQVFAAVVSARGKGTALEPPPSPPLPPPPAENAPPVSDRAARVKRGDSAFLWEQSAVVAIHRGPDGVPDAVFVPPHWDLPGVEEYLYEQEGLEVAFGAPRHGAGYMEIPLTVLSSRGASSSDSPPAAKGGSREERLEEGKQRAKEALASFASKVYAFFTGEE